jgi:hypothetical protein
MRGRFTTAVVVCAIAIAGGIAGAQIASCADGHCIFLPSARAAGESCADRAPPNADGSSGMWMTHYTVATGDPLLACISTPFQGIEAYAIVRQVHGDLITDRVPTTPGLFIVVPIPTEGLTPGELVGIDVIVVTGAQSSNRFGPMTVLVRTP